MGLGQIKRCGEYCEVMGYAPKRLASKALNSFCSQVNKHEVTTPSNPSPVTNHLSPQKSVVSAMQTREHLYEILNYHEYGSKLDSFSKD
jgi:hypothetical protein